MKLNLKLRPELLLLFNALTVMFAAFAFTAFMQTDRIVHGTLYDYGLRFDLGWADPYWIFFRVSMAMLLGVAGVGSFSMLYVVLARKSLAHEPSVAVVPARVTEPVVSPVKPGKEKDRKTRGKETSDDGVEIVAIPMVCNKCGKVFTQPLCMFDFRSGKPRLVNVCPYCNAVLTVSGNGIMK